MQETKQELGVQKWSNAIVEHTHEHERLIKEGYKLFFQTALSLPSRGDHYINALNFEESDIQFVHLTSDNLDNLTLIRLRQIQDVLGFWPPMDVGLFNVVNDRSEAHKGKEQYSAYVVVRQSLSGIFRSSILFHVFYQSSINWQENLYEKGIRHTLFGDLRANPANKTQLQLLESLNNLALIYSEAIKSQQS